MDNFNPPKDTELKTMSLHYLGILSMAYLPSSFIYEGIQHIHITIIETEIPFIYLFPLKLQIKPIISFLLHNSLSYLKFITNCQQIFHACVDL